MFLFQIGFFIFFYSNYTGSGTPITFYSIGTNSLLRGLGVGKLGREADHLTESNATVRMRGAKPTYTHTHTLTHTRLPHLKTDTLNLLYSIHFAMLFTMVYFVWFKLLRCQ